MSNYTRHRRNWTIYAVEGGGREICGMDRAALTLVRSAVLTANSLAVMKQTPTGIHTVSPYSRSQRAGPGREGKAAHIRMSRTSRFLTSRHLASLSLNLRSLCTFSLAVLSPGSVGKHDSLDGLLCLLLRHLAHPAHRPRHAGPGKSNVSLTRRQWG